MPATVKVITPADDALLTLDELKTHLRVTHAEEDSYILALGRAALGLAERHLSRTVMASRLRLTLDAVPASGVIELPNPPVRAVVQVRALVDGVWVSSPAANYRLDADSVPVRLVPLKDQQWPDPDAGPGTLQIDYDAGWALAEQVPNSIKQAVRLIVGHLYENRESVVTGTIATEIPFGAAALLEAERVLQFG
jgi:uncharacterized phiE125 gp8 family phage protein